MKLRNNTSYTNNTSDLAFHVIRICYENERYYKVKGYFVIKGRYSLESMTKKNYKIYKKDIDKANWFVYNKEVN